MRPARLKPRRSAPALIVSLGLHALALTVLALSVRLPPVVVEPPAVEVELLRLPRTDPLLRSLPPPRPIAPRQAPVPPVDAPPPPPDLRGAADRTPTEPSPATPERAEHGPFVNFFQDNLKGCEREALMLMPASEQEGCRARIAAAALAAPRSFRGAAPPIEALSGLSAARRAVLDAEVARRARSGAPGKAPVSQCAGRLGDLGAGCLTDSE